MKPTKISYEIYCINYNQYTSVFDDKDNLLSIYHTYSLTHLE